MISADLAARIRRLFFGEHWKVGTIAAELGLHHATVARAVDHDRFINVAYRARASKLDPYREFIRVTVEAHPRLCATRVHEMVRQRGFEGAVWTVRRYMHTLPRHTKKEAFFRLTVLPGEQAQVDWGHFGSVTVGATKRALSCFVMVLSYSRALFARFVLDQTLESFLRCHVAAFSAFGGTPRAVLYDNLKSVVLERSGSIIRFQPRLLDFAGHYHFEPRPVGIARGNEKGRVERAIRYLRESFFAARRFRDVEHLNTQLAVWTQDIAHARLMPGDAAGRTVGHALSEEQSRLLALPKHPPPCDLVRATVSGKTPYVRFDGNDYSIPHELVRTPLTLVASDVLVRVLDGERVVAAHTRSWDKRQQIEQEAHLAALSDHKRAAREHRGRHRLGAACASAEIFLDGVARHGGHLGGTTARLLRLLDQHGAGEVEAALAEAHERQAFSAHSVAHIVDRRRRGRAEPPPLPTVLPRDPRVRDLVVPARALDTYDTLAAPADTEVQR